VAFAGTAPHWGALLALFFRPAGSPADDGSQKNCIIAKVFLRLLITNSTTAEGEA